MKNIISMLPLGIFMIGIIFTGCQSADQKTEAAKAKVEDAKEDLRVVEKEANTETQKAANLEEWKNFKSESELKIKNNESHISELKIKMKKQGKTFDTFYAIRIDALEQKNKDLKARMDAYEKSQSDWESFKREFNHDMDELGQALKDLTIDNK